MQSQCLSSGPLLTAGSHELKAENLNYTPSSHSLLADILLCVRLHAGQG